MAGRHARTIGMAGVMAAVLAAPAPAGAGPLRAGVAEVKITPELGSRIAGYPRIRVATSVKSDLYARAMVFESGGRRIAIVANDLVAVPASVVGPAKERIAATCGIGAEAVMICATHTHTGPEIRNAAEAPYDYSADPQYVADLVRNMAAAVEQAGRSMFEATVQVGQAEETQGYARNRYRRLKDGRDIVGYGDLPGGTGDGDEILGFAGPVDNSVQTLCLRDAANRVRGLAVNFALHPNSGKKADYFWAEWPGETARCIAERYGADVPCLVLQGAGGDIQRNPVHSPERAGEGIAEAAVKANENAARPIAGTVLDCRLEVLRIPYCSRLELAREIAYYRRKKDISEADMRLMTSLIRHYEGWDRENTIADVPVQCLRIGDVAVVGIPAEPFTVLGLEIKKRSPAARTLVVGYANDKIGYMPPADQATRGAYGERACEARWLVAEAAEQVVDAALASLHEMWP